ncbi:MAG: LuxR family transcriptional regulator [Rhodobacterales bacterium 65-51]|uniref:helix-turn-helix transcriptional regulator n=1 Tax=uncultured Gemmobacter sp. TaxID=1095917 RepID=UPI00095C397A|nr:helix-turn-helix transcriptional regulator [uncultured Gemmobacter sp.]OJY36250.1 MAG: LuxR family transcriptional regulator [Rhodobacterales bacterium 65-51]
MPDQTHKGQLADQAFLFGPEDGRAPEDGATADPIDMQIVASTYRSIVDQDAFEDMIASWAAKLDQIEPETGRRRGLSQQLFGQLMMARHTLETLDIPAENDPLKRAITDVPGPAVVLTPDGRVAMANIAGERAFATKQGAFLDTEVIAPASLQDYTALMRAARGQGNAAQAILTVIPPPETELPPFTAEGYMIAVRGQSGAHVALRSLEIAWEPSVSARLREAFGLSAAEAEVARLFFLLRDIDRIAEARAVSRLTVRTQVKTIMSKVEAPTNVDLMRLLAMIAGREAMGQRGESPVWQDPLGREDRIETPDGRVVTWTWMGARDGRPAVLLRGFPMTYILPPEAEDRLRRAGVKLYALSRPGYGNSSLHKDLDVRQDNQAALRMFLDRVIRQPCLGIGMSNGFVPLLEEQQANPARFHALMAIGYTGVLDRSGIHRLQPIQRTMMLMAAHTPWLAELVAKSAHRMMRQHGVDWYLERAYRTRPLDMRTCQNPEMAALIRNACEHLLKQGHGAFVRDLQLAGAPIDAAIEALTIPLLFLAPVLDGVFDEMRYRQIERRNPRIRVEPVADAGELIFYQQSRLIVDRIIELSRAPQPA